MALTWWEKGLWQICMHHWTVHEKVDFPKILPAMGEYIPQLLVLNSDMKPKKFPNLWGVHSTTCDTTVSNTFIKKFQTVRTCFTAKGAKMHKYRTVPTCFTAKKHTKLLPKSIAVHTHHSWKQEWDVTIVIPTIYCNVTPDVTFGGYIPQLLILNSQMKQKNFPIWGGIFHNCSSWTQKWKIYIDIFYRVCCNINHITAISNLYLQ